MGDADCKNKKTNIFFAKTIDKTKKQIYNSNIKSEQQFANVNLLIGG